MQGGSLKRFDASANMDVFSYLSKESRRSVAQHMLPSRGTFDASGVYMGEAEVRRGARPAGEGRWPGRGTGEE